MQTRLRTVAGSLRRRGSLAVAIATAPLRTADLAVFHALEPSPSGGGHQFMRALLHELRRRGLRVERDRISARTPACLFNSYNFDFDRLERLVHEGCRLVHRVDGPIGVYRGHDDGADARIAEINLRLADATVFQSRYSLEEHRRLGLELVAPVVIHNAVDPAIFYPPAGPRAARAKPLVIATSWSDNPRKGADTLEWLDARHDDLPVEVLFVGRTRARLTRIRSLPPVPSYDLAELLRDSDAYLAPSRHESCSNALLEALACGLPSVYVRSGGNPELVGGGGIGFTSEEELLDALQRLPDELEELRSRIAVPSLSEVADRYLEVLRG